MESYSRRKGGLGCFFPSENDGGSSNSMVMLSKGRKRHFSKF